MIIFDFGGLCVAGRHPMDSDMFYSLATLWEGVRIFLRISKNAAHAQNGIFGVHALKHHV